MERIRLNLIIDRDEDELVYAQLTALPKGPKRIAAVKRMIHLAGLIERGSLPLTLGTQPAEAGRMRKQPSEPGGARPPSQAEADVDAFFGPSA